MQTAVLMHKSFYNILPYEIRKYFTNMPNEYEIETKQKTTCPTNLTHVKDDKSLCLSYWVKQRNDIENDDKIVCLSIYM